MEIVRNFLYVFISYIGLDRSAISVAFPLILNKLANRKIPFNFLFSSLVRRRKAYN